jgi:hypothetical protein
VPCRRRRRQIVGTTTIDDYADPEFWRPEDHLDSALYLHRMIVALSARGSGLDLLMLNLADRLAARSGRSLLRLDAWRTNTALHAYYASVGFKHVRTVDLPHRGSGTLLERPVLVGPYRPARSDRLHRICAFLRMLRETRRERSPTVASIEEIVNQIQSATDKIDEAVSSLSAAESDAEELQGQMAAFGVQDKAQELLAVKDAIEKAKTHLLGGADLTNEASDLAKSAGG